MNTNNQDTLNEDKITKLEKPLTLFLKGGSNAIHNRNEVKSLDKGRLFMLTLKTKTTTLETSPSLMECL